MQTFELVTLWLMSLIAALFVGSYLKSYLGKKGENLARKEDIDKLTAEVAAVTKTTKEIESKISGELWDKQRRWELKRDLFLDVVRKSVIMNETLTKLFAVYSTEKQNEIQGKPPRLETRIQAGDSWGRAAADFDEAVFLMSLICGVELRKGWHALGFENRRISQEITNGRPERFGDSVKDWVARREKLLTDTRRELGIE